MYLYIYIYTDYIAIKIWYFTMIRWDCTGHCMAWLTWEEPKYLVSNTIGFFLGLCSQYMGFTSLTGDNEIVKSNNLSHLSLKMLD